MGLHVIALVTVIVLVSRRLWARVTRNPLYAEQRQTGLDEIKGGSPYGASTITGTRGERRPSALELGMARFQGAHVARITAALTR